MSGRQLIELLSATVILDYLEQNYKVLYTQSP
ncbi:MAG: DUF3791 domain-containing protein [Bacteroides sp.]|nr:DUF3791 domain-containing protein [Bacteroides sp.]